MPESKGDRTVQVGFNHQQLVLLDRLARSRGQDRATVLKAVMDEYRAQHPELQAVEGAK